MTLKILSLSIMQNSTLTRRELLATLGSGAMALGALAGCEKAGAVAQPSLSVKGRRPVDSNEEYVWLSAAANLPLFTKHDHPALRLAADLHGNAGDSRFVSFQSLTPVLMNILHRVRESWVLCWYQGSADNVKSGDRGTRVNRRPDHRRFWAWLAVVGMALLDILTPKPAWAEERAAPPNIVLILADDLGWGQVGFNGNRYYATPHLDQMSAEGVRFTQAYSASPVCSPTRAALMTGLDPARLHLTNFIPGNPYPWGHLRQPDWQKFLPLERVTIAERLSAAGYVTGLVGKWHLAKGYFPPASVEQGPDRQGFQETFIAHKPGNAADPENDAHNVESITQRSLRFLREHRHDTFFLEIAHNTVHAPIMERKEIIQRYQSKPGSNRCNSLYAQSGSGTRRSLLNFVFCKWSRRPSRLIWLTSRLMALDTRNPQAPRDKSASY